jgi:hypothetical protein
MKGRFGFWALDQGTEEIGAGRTQALESLVWRVDLSADPGQASASLAQAEASLAKNREALNAAEGRFGRFVKTLPKGEEGGGRVTRGILPRPERTLLALLADARAGVLPVGQDGENRLSEGWQTSVDGFQAFIAGVQASMATDSRVETRVEGQLIAQTRANRLGDLQTIWLEKTDEAYRAVHQRSLQAALDGLHLMLETLAVNARMAGELSGLIENAEGGLLALPLAWRFITDIWSES